jgi:hypothetical protein
MPTFATPLPPPSVPMDTFRLRVPADGGQELMARMAHYGLQWSSKKMQETLAKWAAAGGSPAVEG